MMGNVFFKFELCFVWKVNLNDFRFKLNTIIYSIHMYIVKTSVLRFEHRYNVHINRFFLIDLI